MSRPGSRTRHRRVQRRLRERLAARQPAAWVPPRIRALADRQPDRRPR